VALIDDTPPGHRGFAKRPVRLIPERAPAREPLPSTGRRVPWPLAIDERAGQRHPGRQAIPSPAAQVTVKRPIARWIAAFNARDLDAMLAWTHPDVDFHPLWLPGVRRTYRGHDGVRRWFAALQYWHHPHRINLSEITRSNDGQTLAIGNLSHKRSSQLTPFCALHSLADELIIAAYHHLSDPDSLLAVGPPRPTES